MKALNLLLCVLAWCVASGCGRSVSDTESSAPTLSEVDSVHPVADITLQAEEWADSMTNTLTLRQKISRLFMPAVYAKDDYWTLRQVREYADSCIGGVILLKGDVDGARNLIDTIRAVGRWPVCVAIDAEWGLAMRLTDAPVFPVNGSLAPGVDDQLMYDYGRELARECRLVGIDMVLGPVVDISEPGGVMKKRSLGSDPRRVADLSVAYARGLEDGGIISVAKHFPGHGSVEVDSHKRKGIIRRSLNEMDSTDIYPFRQWILHNLTGIMVGHLAVPSVDPEMLPAAVSPAVITSLLKEDMGFRGLVLTDAINMKGAEGYGALEAVKAGADIVLAPVDTWKEIKRIEKAMAEGELDEAMIDERVRKIFFYSYLFSHDHVADFVRESGSLNTAVTDTLWQRLSGKK